MELQRLPQRIRASLRTIIGERNFSPDAEFNITRCVNTEISSSCTVQVSEGERNCYLFIKYLNRSRGGFGGEALAYFRNEIVFYEKILKEFKIFVNELTGRPTPLAFAPGCLAVGDPSTEPPFIIMEDLVSEGYVPLDVKEPSSLERALTVLRQLGQFHAASFAMRSKHPHAFARATSQLRETAFRHQSRGTVGKLFIHSIHDAFKLAKQSFPPDSVYVQKLASFTLNVFENMITLIEGDEEDETYKVVTHGDLWPNNVLYKPPVNDTEPTEGATFVDYHACRLASPVHDLQLFLLVGLDQPTRQRHRADLIRHYHTALCRTLQDLGCDPLTLFPLSALHSQLVKHSRFALAAALAGLPLFLDEGPALRLSGTNDVDAYVRELRTRKSMRCKNKMLEVVMDVVDQGYL